MYRLADMVGLDGLKTLALQDIRTQLSSVKIMNEAFSEFTSRYSDILDAEVTYMCTLDLSLSSLLMALLEEKISQVARGEMPHAQAVIMALLRRLSEKAISPIEDVEEYLTPQSLWDVPKKVKKKRKA